MGWFFAKRQTRDEESKEQAVEALWKIRNEIRQLRKELTRLMAQLERGKA